VPPPRVKTTVPEPADSTAAAMVTNDPPTCSNMPGNGRHGLRLNQRRGKEPGSGPPVSQSDGMVELGDGLRRIRPGPIDSGSGRRASGHRAGRKAGALVVLVDGELVLYVERGGKTLLSWTEDEHVRARLQERVGKLMGGSATLLLGNTTDAANEVQDDLARRTTAALRAALRDGVVLGSGRSLLACQDELKRRIQMTGDEHERAAYRILVAALEEQQDQAAAQRRARLLFVGMAAVHHHIDRVEAALEEALIGLELERVRHDAGRVREHAVVGDDGITFDTGRLRHASHCPAQLVARQVGSADSKQECY